jgi:tRNA threonylcarbamoyladenosine biosynthesis protein TsaB
MRGFLLETPQAPDSPTILAIDTTTGTCSAALLHAGDCDHLVELLGPAHSRRALAMVSELLQRRQIGPDRLDAIAFGAGPGSFTGLRVACGLAQGLGFGWRLPLVPIGSMATLAWQACAVVAADLILVAIDARMGEVYRSAWRRSGTRIEPLLAVAAVTPAQAAADFSALSGGAPRLAVAGDGFVACEPLRAWASANGAATPDAARQTEAAAVARLASQAFVAGSAIAAEDAAPIYVRDKVALDVAEQAALRARRVRPEPA